MTEINNLLFNCVYKPYCRTYQSIFRLVSYFLPWNEPKLLKGENSLARLPEIIKQNKIDNVMIVTGKHIPSTGIMRPLLEGLGEKNISFAVYDKTVPNPTVSNVEEALKLYRESGCKGIIGFGGGSPMDCAKGVAARMARPEKSIREMKGVLKIRRKTPLLFAVPTTAGTGSETTIAAVFADNITHEKFAVIDSVLLPDWAVLDPVLTEKLPEHITAATGIDALTHAVEAYIGKSNTKKTKEQSRLATKLIFENMLKVYSLGDNTAARQNMLEASYLAGLAFTRAYVGNVHAIAHALGGLYSIPHGLANAVVLPRVLEAYGRSAQRSLAELADLVGLTSSENCEELKASKFIEAVKKLNQRMGIPEKLDEIKEEDIPALVDMAFSESNPLYPVPRIFSRDDFKRIYHSIM